MSDDVVSPYWYRVAKLKPMLREEVEIARHRYRGQIWYVLHNRFTGRSQRFNAAAYHLIGIMDGQRSVQEIWDYAEASDAERAPSQEGLIRLLGQLHQSGLIQSDILPNMAELLKRAQGERSATWRQSLANPLSVRLPMGNPDRFLSRRLAWAGALLHPAVFALWLIIVLCALVAALQHWSDLSHRLTDQLLLPANLLMLWLIYPVMKLVHELGHAVAVKKWGGEVNEMGIMLLALTPIPYVDASASAMFSAKHQRMAVAAMGMMVELLLAALALFVWLNVEPGLVSAAAYNVMLIGGISTLAFNGNPLLRYDGYYLFADLIEVPNLGQRANQYLGYCVKRYLLRVDATASPLTTPGERAWFLIYGPLAFCYRILVVVGLIWMVSGRFFILGILIAVWGGATLLVLPAMRTLSRLMEELQHQRSRVTAAVLGTAIALGLLLFSLPMPYWTTSQGVIWLPEDAVVRAGTDCEIETLTADSGVVVDKGDPLLRGSDPLLDTRRALHQAELEELRARYHALPLRERVKRRIVQEDIDRVAADLRQVEEKIEELVVRSPARGRLVLIDERRLAGSVVHEGELLGYIIADHRPTVRTVVGQDAIGLVRSELTGVEIRLFEALSTSMQASVSRIIPAADFMLPSAALGTAGGGEIPVDPSDPEARRALEPYFQLDLSLPAEIHHPHIGGRVHVRFDHGCLPVGLQWYRSLRQLFLRRFYV